MPTLRATKAQYIVIQVFAEKCGPCMEEALKLSALAREWSERGIAVIGMSYDSQPESVKRFFDDTGKRVTFPLYCAPWFAEKHEVVATPTLFVFSAEGKKLHAADPLSEASETPLDAILSKLAQLPQAAP
ncbi:MAG: TlpA family protein disulfide reductase [Planctomycetota bacterium]|nr:TlpA family protein disulfide reductase [Planctomycetota bacterium]